MTLRLSTTLRTTRATDIITAAGAAAKMKFWNGTKPASFGTTPGGTLLGTLTFGSVIGTSSSGVLTFGSVTQSNGSHVNGTPTFVTIETSGGTVVADLDIGGGAGNMQFTGTIATGTDITLNASTITEGNA